MVDASGDTAKGTDGVGAPGLRRVLMIAAAFPPTGGSGVQRSVKFAKYLPRWGWTPMVWACRHLEGLPSDAALLEDVPSTVEIYHLHRRRSIAGRNGQADSLRPHGGGRLQLPAALAWRRHKRRSQQRAPDPLARWARRSVRPLLRLLKRHPVDAIYSTFSPASNHLLAMWLKERTGLPWVADFRDLWTDDYRYVEEDPSLRLLHRRLEHEFLRAADAVVGVTPRQTALLARHVPDEAGKFTTIPNGFDPEDWEKVEPGPGRGNGPFVIAHVGRLDRWRVHEEWLAALRRFVADMGDECRGRAVLRIVGHVDQGTLEALRGTGIECEVTGYVPHREAVREMSRADVLLLLVPGGRNAESVIPAKLFEYLAARRPILMVGPEGSVCRDVIEECASGMCVGFTASGIARLMRAMYDDWQQCGPRLSGKPETIAQYSRVGQTAGLARVLDGIAASRTVPTSDVRTHIAESA